MLNLKRLKKKLLMIVIKLFLEAHGMVTLAQNTALVTHCH